MRRQLITANWKLHKTIAQAREWVKDVSTMLAKQGVVPGMCDVVVAPPYTALWAMSQVVGDAIALAGQDIYFAEQGAFTGAISGPLLKDAGCQFVLVGHSERRQLFGETLESSRLRLNAALAADLTPILCVGEMLEQRDAGRTEAVIAEQINAAIADVRGDSLQRIIIAYEPVWAIGTGRVATPQQAQDAHAFIRAQLAQRSVQAAQHVRIVYGGSVKPENASELLVQADIDGALVGGASLDAAAFASIVRAGITSSRSYESWFDTQFAASDAES